MQREKATMPLTLEEYVEFYHHAHVRSRLSHRQLNQIISMHGFVKPNRVQKALIVDALNSLELIPPERSTVQEKAAMGVADPAAVLSLEEAKRDVLELGWQECPLGSIITVSAAVDVAIPISSSTCPSRLNTSTAASGGAKKEVGGKKKRKRTLLLADMVPLALMPPPM